MYLLKGHLLIYVKKIKTKFYCLKKKKLKQKKRKKI